MRDPSAFEQAQNALLPHPLGLSEATRYRIVDEVVDYLLRDGRPELNQAGELRPLPNGVTGAPGALKHCDTVIERSSRWPVFQTSHAFS
jgi:hypothetical protein